MLKNTKVVLFVTLKSWSGWKSLDPTTYTDQAESNIILHMGIIQIAQNRL